MARLLPVTAGLRAAELLSWTVIGRSPTADITVQSELVSGHHAVVHWSDGAWHVRDLGSRNGTFVDGERIPTGQGCRLRTGQSLMLGDMSFVAEDLAPPVARAVRADDGLVLEDERLLAIPDAQSPLATVHFDKAGHWVLETEQRVQTVCDGAVVDVAGQSWTLRLPVGIVQTVDALQRRTLVGAALSVHVSRNQESVLVRVEGAGGPVVLDSRAHSYLLFLLARQVVTDAELPVPERGWIDQVQLSEMLRVERRIMNVQIYRARQQLLGAGFVDGAQIIERRRASGELRLGILDVQIP